MQRPKVAARATASQCHAAYEMKYGHAAQAQIMGNNSTSQNEMNSDFIRFNQLIIKVI